MKKIKWYNQREVAEIFEVSIKTIKAWRCKGRNGVRLRCRRNGKAIKISSENITSFNIKYLETL